jgi:hypothetical protein
MNSVPAISTATYAANNVGTQPQVPSAGAKNSPEFVEAFNMFVGQTLYGTMLKSMRATVGETPYFNGGKAEELFTRQLDQVLAEKLSKTSAGKFSEPMLKLSQLQRM